MPSDDAMYICIGTGDKELHIRRRILHSADRINIL